MRQTRSSRWLLHSLLGCAIALGAGISGCGQSVLLPLGSDNNLRVAGDAASASWAAPMKSPGLPNLHRVSQDLYRGAQPTGAGIRQLEVLGVRTVVNLRTSDTDGRLLAGSGLAYERIPMTAWRPKDRDVVQFLRIVSDESRQPVFIHCRRGADRTGMMVAVYRVAVQGWEKEQAIAEMTQGGFRFNSGWRNLVQYVRDLDISAIRQQAGLGDLVQAR